MIWNTDLRHQVPSPSKQSRGSSRVALIGLVAGARSLTLWAAVLDTTLPTTATPTRTDEPVLNPVASSKHVLDEPRNHYFELSPELHFTREFAGDSSYAEAHSDGGYWYYEERR